MDTIGQLEAGKKLCPDVATVAADRLLTDDRTQRPGEIGNNTPQYAEIDNKTR
jgi:hypothetical protein